MMISDIMTRSVLSVGPDASVRSIAQLLVEHGISAVPVVEDGIPIGIVSETDLVRRASAMKTSGSGWLSALLKAPAENVKLDDVFSSKLNARDVMTSPIIAVSGDATLEEVLQIMVARSVKRLPVLDRGRICGIVSRPDVLRAVSVGHARQPDSGALLRARPHASAPGYAAAVDTLAPSESGEEVISASALRSTAESYKAHMAQIHVIEQRHVKEAHEHEIEAFLEQPLTADFWRDMLLRARSAADHGAVELEIIRFPCGVCSDAGRAINNGAPGWAQSLRGLPAAIWQRWHDELQAKGFRMKARIIDFPEGVPGNVGLVLSWNRF